MYHEFFAQMRKQLAQLGTWLDAAAAHARANDIDPAELLQLRLAPDQFPFVRQVQISCDTLKLAASRLAGKEAPSHPDTETSLDELHARVRTVLAWPAASTASATWG